jgi:hypothetical protein
MRASGIAEAAIGKEIPRYSGSSSVDCDILSMVGVMAQRLHFFEASTPRRLGAIDVHIRQSVRS